MVRHNTRTTWNSTYTTGRSLYGKFTQSAILIAFITRHMANLIFLTSSTMQRTYFALISMPREMSLSVLYRAEIQRGPVLQREKSFGLSRWLNLCGMVKTRLISPGTRHNSMSGPKRPRPARSKSVRDVACIPITRKFTNAIAACRSFYYVDRGVQVLSFVRRPRRSTRILYRAFRIQWTWSCIAFHKHIIQVQ